MSSPLDAVAREQAGADLPVAVAVEEAEPERDRPERHTLVRDLMLNPTTWRIWPALAVLRWLQRRMKERPPRVMFRSRPSLGFAASEVADILFRESRIDLVLNAPGLATSGSPLPAADIARIIEDYQSGGALSAWLDGPGDLFMHLLEDVQMRCNPAYALLTGGPLEAFALSADIVGRSAPLSASAGGDFRATSDGEPAGAVGLAGLFLGPITAAGLGALFRAVTGLPVRVREFAGDEVPVAAPARMGMSFGLMLGSRCELPSAGVEVHIEGGSDPGARQWAADPVRRSALDRLARAYIGAPFPRVRLNLWLDGGNAPPAILDRSASLGGLAVLGESAAPVRIPLSPLAARS